MSKKHPKNFIHQKRTGVKSQEGCSYLDVKNACESFLNKRGLKAKRPMGFAAKQRSKAPV